MLNLKGRLNYGSANRLIRDNYLPSCLKMLKHSLSRSAAYSLVHLSLQGLLMAYVPKSTYLQLTHELKQAIDTLLTIQEKQRRSYFNQLKEYPPSAKISALKSYLERYKSRYRHQAIQGADSQSLFFTLLIQAK